MTFSPRLKQIILARLGGEAYWKFVPDSQKTEEFMDALKAFEKEIIQKFGSMTNYQNWWLKQHGYNSRSEYYNEQAQRKGFKNYQEYKDWLYQNKGFKNEKAFKRWDTFLKRCRANSQYTRKQIHELFELRENGQKRKINRIIKYGKDDEIKCPFCNSDDIILNGILKLKIRGTNQRYTCMKCKRRFNKYTNTPQLRRYYNIDTYIYAVELVLAGISYRESVRMTKEKFGSCCTHEQIHRLSKDKNFLENLDNTKIEILKNQYANYIKNYELEYRKRAWQAGYGKYINFKDKSEVRK